MGDFEGAADNSQKAQTSLLLGLCYASCLHGWKGEMPGCVAVSQSSLGSRSSHI